MKTVDILPPQNLSNQFRFHCTDTKGEPVSHSIPKTLLDFTPSGNFSSQDVGTRILTVGHFRDEDGRRQYFLMFNAVGEEEDCLHRQGRIWSSALVSGNKQELILHFLAACRTDRLPVLFPCLTQLPEMIQHSSEHFLEDLEKYDFWHVRALTSRLRTAQSVTLSTPQECGIIYQPAERLIFNSFRFHDLVGCSFNGIADNTFDLCIVAGSKNSLANYLSSKSSNLKGFENFLKSQSVFEWKIFLILISVFLIFAHLYL